ncbi:TetR/AcrR family transcriptional regulator [Novosphingobium sp. Fuku2-ISO-50]|uniref:TetR/AcrR family transcriptional regulator n=1 Tax=Novosphingobium sp. Fuku2-ISO-50 TaxID=1739114 RepID=UPI0009EC036D|nr:TetR/AcrR family transcriptional regulator [Novosphingobium sp. Fuku2-ISO-50]
MKSPLAKRAKRPKPSDAAPRACAGSGRHEILVAALNAFARDTFGGASLPDIARQAGVGTPLIHYHFGTKEKLWKATVAYAFDELVRPLHAIAAASRDLQPVDGLRLLCRTLIQFASEYPEHVLVLINEARTPGERLEWVIENHLRIIHGHFDRMIERAVAAGQIKAIPAVHLTNIIIQSIVYFYPSVPLISNLYGVDRQDSETFSSHGDWIIEVIFRGIQTAPGS